MSFFLDVIQLFFRMIPHPTKPRLICNGNPTSTSLVLVTVNSSLTVRRLLRAIKGIDCFVLVAPARGINVWCGSVGGHFSLDSIISIIKTSGIEQLVRNKILILPLLSAPSIPLKELYRRTGWHGMFGPLRAQDIPAFFRNGRQLDEPMTRVRYETKDRLEMGVAMSGSIIIRFCLFPLLVLGMQGVAWFSVAVVTLSVAMHLFGDRLSMESNTRKALLFSPVVAPLLMSFIGSWLDVVILASIVSGASYLVGSAYAGYAPFKQCSYSKQFYGFTPLNIRIVAEDCTGCDICDKVCPVDCFELTSTSPRLYDIVRPENCVECRACLVQCPTDAVINAHAETFGCGATKRTEWEIVTKA